MSAIPRNLPDAVAAPTDGLMAALGDALGDRSDLQLEVTPEGFVELAAPDGRLVVAESVPRPTRPSVLEAWNRLQPRARAQGAIPVLMLSEVPRSLRSVLASERISWVDWAGNGHVAARP